MEPKFSRIASNPFTKGKQFACKSHKVTSAKNYLGYKRRDITFLSFILKDKRYKSKVILQFKYYPSQVLGEIFPIKKTF